jgi:hypothetical protein
MEDHEIIEQLTEALEAVLWRCKQEGCGTTWAPLKDAQETLDRVEEWLR